MDSRVGKIFSGKENAFRLFGFAMENRAENDFQCLAAAKIVLLYSFSHVWFVQKFHRKYEIKNKETLTSL